MSVLSEHWGMLDLPEVAWPCTYRYHMRAPWGDTQTEVTVNVPLLQDDLEGSMRLGVELWRRSIAAAITREVELLEHDTVCWRLAPAGLPMTHAFTTGLLGGSASSRKDAACMLLMPERNDRRTYRRLCLPGVPQSWLMGGMLTPNARGALESLGQAMMMGMCGSLVGGPTDWLIAYPEALPASADNPNGVGFRPVRHLRVFWFTSPAPEPSGEPWP